MVTEEGRRTTGKERQRGGAENTTIRRNLPLFIGRCFIVVVSSVSKVDREGTIDATYFRTIKFPILIWLDLAFSYLHVGTVCTNINLVKQKGKCQIKVGSIERFENCNRVMKSCVCVIARNANSNGRFSDEMKSQI